MAWKQLVTPNINVPGYSGGCLAYVDDGVNPPNRKPTAQASWDYNVATNVAHPNEEPPNNVWVPVYYSIDNGPWAGYGHVAWFYSNGTTTKIYDSEFACGNRTTPYSSGAELLRYMGWQMRYLGWSESLDGLRMVSNDGSPNPPTPGDGGKATSTGPKGKVLIKDFEKCVLTAYDNNDGMITIGWGHAEPKGYTNLVAGVTRWTQAQADSAFENDIKKYEKAVNDYFTRSFNQNQFDAMVSFTYNLGVGIFANDGWDKNASNEYILASLPKYINKGSAHEQGLIRRRNAEIALFNTPVSGGSETNKGEIEMYLIMTIDTKNWYVSNGVQCKWIKSERFLNNFQNDFGKLNLPVDKMYSTELYKEFPKDTIIVK
jgi:lysozyme